MIKRLLIVTIGLLILTGCNRYKHAHNTEMKILVNGCNEYIIQTGYDTYKTTLYEDGNTIVKMDTAFYYYGFKYRDAIYIRDSYGNVTVSSYNSDVDTLFSVVSAWKIKFKSLEEAKKVINKEKKRSDSVRKCNTWTLLK